MADTDEAEKLARLAIDRIIQDARAAIKPHMDNITRLQMMKAPAVAMVRDPGKSDAPLAAAILGQPNHSDLCGKLAMREFYHRNNGEGEYDANLLMRARHAIEGTEW